MTRSEELNELAGALSLAQGEFGAVPKGSVNPFFHSTYADLAAVVQTAAPVLAKYGLSVTQIIDSDEQGDTLTTMLLHKSGQYISGTMQLKPTKNDPQSQGSATTYARRYAYMAALGLVADSDDDGNTATKNAQPAASRKPQMTDASSQVRKPPAKRENAVEKVAASTTIASAPMRKTLTSRATAAGYDAQMLSTLMADNVGKDIDDANLSIDDVNKLLGLIKPQDPERPF